MMEKSLVTEKNRDKVHRVTLEKLTVNEQSSVAPAAAVETSSERKPRDSELDIYGLTHIGHLRKTNQDHFLISMLRREVRIMQTSLRTAPDDSSTERLALLACVADGVGSSVMGEEAARLAVERIMAYVMESANCYYASDEMDGESLSRSLAKAAMRVHADIAKERAEGPIEASNMATTLTLWLGVWPKAYLVQVGDSRCYVMRGGVLAQISRDQTMAQDLVEMGAMTRTQAERSPLSHVLSSAIGGETALPVVTMMEQSWDSIGLLCSDGLTKHVSDEQITHRLNTMTSAKQVCETLLQDALDAGGSDNVTIVVGRPKAKI